MTWAIARAEAMRIRYPDPKKKKTRSGINADFDPG